MTRPLPIGVLLPTFNSMPLLPAHMDSVAAWLDHVEEVVVVDSHSTDGTLEWLQRCLRHPRLRFFSHPRGLYQSWNYGIQQLRSTYTYISTIGDSISPDGLAHLCDVAERHACDVVVSPPRFIFDDGPPEFTWLWPIHRIIQMLGLTEPRVFQGMPVFLLAMKYQPGALLSSSASDLYRTAVLQQRPFPTEYGGTGDCAWVILNSFDIRLGFTPKEFSTFRIHTKPYSPSDYAVDNLRDKFFVLATGLLRQRIAQNEHLREQCERLHLEKALESLQRYRASRQQLDEHRQRSLPWFCNPAAWRARHLRKQSRAQLNDCLNHLAYTETDEPLLTGLMRSFIS